MKRLLKFLFTIGLIFLACLTSVAQNKLIGLWKGVDQGEVGYVNFDSTGYAYFIIENDTLGGETYTMNGHEAYMKYEVNYTKSLMTLDFILYLKSDNLEIGRLPGIFKFDEKDRLILCVNFESNERPSTFIEEDTIELEKMNTLYNK